MTARRSVPATETDAGKDVEGTNAHGGWSRSDETTLLHFLLECEREVANDLTFDTATWNAAAARIEQRREAGVVTGTVTCQQKWEQLRDTFRIVNAVKKHFAFSWDNEHGANIDTRLEDIWTAYIERHPEASPFRNEGWPHYDDMMRLIPTKQRQYRREESHNGSSSGDGNEVETDPEISRTSSIMPGKRQYSEISHEDSLGSEVLVVVAQAALLAVMGAMQLFLHKRRRINFLPPDSEELATTRMQRALKHVQELEDDLDVNQVVSLINLFMEDRSSVDAYLDCEHNEDIRKAWVREKLANPDTMPAGGMKIIYVLRLGDCSTKLMPSGAFVLRSHE